MPRSSDGGPTRPETFDGRNGLVWRKYTVYRMTQAQIASDLGLTQQRVSQILQEVRESLPEDDKALMRAESLELYRELTRRAMEIADLVPTPVAVGRDGTILREPDGDDGEPGAVVRDYSGRLRAMETAAKFDAETRKLMGLDAATKTEVGGSVRYEVVGVDVTELQ